MKRVGVNTDQCANTTKFLGRVEMRSGMNGGGKVIDGSNKETKEVEERSPVWCH